MKLLALILGVMLVVPACATFQHSESISVDHFGATGTYSDSRSGQLYEMSLGAGGGGGGWGFVGSAAHGPATGFGAGSLAFRIKSTQSQSDPRYFARSIVMVDLSKKLRSVKVDECEGIREYEYIQPVERREGKYQSSPKLPSSFGHQPVQ